MGWFSKKPIADAPPPGDLAAPLGDEARAALLGMLEQLNQHIRERRAAVEQKNRSWAHGWKVLSAADLKTIVGEVAAAKTPGPIAVRNVNTYARESAAQALLRHWAERADVQLSHVVRLLIAIGAIDAERGLMPPSHAALRAVSGKPGASLLALSDALEAHGVSSDRILDDWFGRWSTGATAVWPDAAIWPFFARHLDYLATALRSGGRSGDWWFSRPRLFDALCAFPEVPAELVPALSEKALTGSRADRAGAQRVLDRVPGIEARIVEALSAGKADARIAAAGWLARRRQVDAAPAIEKALAREKNDAAAGALMNALEALGVPTDRFLDRGRLAADAERGLARGVPADLAWFPLDALPAVRWQDSGEPVAAAIVRWLLVQSGKLKSPAPGGVLRRHCAAMVAAEREQLAVYILRAWLAEDVRPVSPRAAEAAARAHARAQHASIKQYPQYHDASLRRLSEDQLYELYLPDFLHRPAGSAIASKGILALVAACGGAEVAPMVQRYLVDYYGTRAAQGKALIQMLAWVDHPAATQLMLSIGSRFRTRGFQEEAARQADLLAERKGWTLDELSDRTVPTAGLDERGEWIIDYGTRQFTARLGANLNLELFHADGKKIAGLPEARRDEDAAVVARHKKQLAAARKELKAVLARQKDRLYEAMCTQRRWRFHDWQQLLHRHPIVGRYCQRLIWLALEEGRPPLSFRPLDDGSLTDVGDNPVEPGADSHIVLAHDSNLAGPAPADWAMHLIDYKVPLLFQQVGKGAYVLPDDSKEAVELEDFRGTVLEAFALRGRAARLGYTRGPAEDGGWFCRYDKRFPTLGIEASIEFTGNELPEENRRVALLSLWFTRPRAEPGNRESRIPLHQVPPVLLSECWWDMRTMAADGAFDPAWEKLT